MDLRRAVLVAFLVICLAPNAAYAHAAYKDSDPKDEATVSSPPSSVWAEYTEPVEEGYLHIYDPCGVQVDDGNTQVTGYRMTVGMSADRAGTYRVDWKAASAIDPHVTSGTFTFVVTDGAACPGEEPPEEEQAPEEEERDDGNKNVSQDDSTQEGQGMSGATVRDRSGKRDTRVKGIRETRDRSKDPATESEDEMVLAQTAPSDRERGIWDGIPLGGFLIAMAVAAAIGAAGGRIYANIMGPRT